MTTSSEIQALACEDCVGRMHLSRCQGINGPVLVAVVEHEPTCPWLARVASSGATIASAAGILTHRFRDTDDARPTGVGDDR